MMICYYTVKHYMRHNDESKLHLLPLIQNVPSTVFFMLRRGSNQWICVLHGTMLVKKLWEKRFIHLIPLKQILMMPKNAQTEICHVFSHHLPWWDNVGDEKQWTGRNVSRAGKKWFITFITPCRAFCLPHLIKSMGNWITIILLMVSKMMRKKKPKKVTWILCSEYKPPLCLYLCNNKPFN